MTRPIMDILACSTCFADEGLRLTAQRLGIDSSESCPRCGDTAGKQLDRDALLSVAYSFFVGGTFHRTAYGGAPIVQFNEHQSTSISCSAWLQSDIAIFEETLGVGFFLYGPRLCMIGEIDPLLELQDPSARPAVIQRILREYPTIVLTPEQNLYRVRLGPQDPTDATEYDAPPMGLASNGRLNTATLSVMYVSPDLDVCIHECRATAEDDAFVATIRATRDLSLLDLTEILEEDATEFESLDLAVHMLFLAGDHSYEITRDIAAAAAAAGLDGVVYPSYFSLLRTGAPPFASSYGLLHRRIPQLAEHERTKIVQNVALFGRPIANGKAEVRCINRVSIRRVQYDLTFGPAHVG